MCYYRNTWNGNKSHSIFWIILSFKLEKSHPLITRVSLCSPFFAADIILCGIFVSLEHCENACIHDYTFSYAHTSNYVYFLSEVAAGVMCSTDNIYSLEFIKLFLLCVHQRHVWWEQRKSLLQVETRWRWHLRHAFRCSALFMIAAA